MKVPTQNKFHRPILNLLSDNKNHLIDEVRKELIISFRLNNDDLKEKLPSGDKSVFEVRYGWARYNLRKYGFIETPTPGELRITSLGVQELKQHKPITKRRLIQRSLSQKDINKLSANEKFEVLESEQENPDDKIDQIIKDAQKGLRESLLETLRQGEPLFFEHVVNNVLKEEYKQEIIQLQGGSNDNGIDGVIGQGFDQIAIQSKRYKANNQVGENDLKLFNTNIILYYIILYYIILYYIILYGAPRGIFVTASSFHVNTAEVRRRFTNIRFIDGQELVNLMIKHKVGVNKTTHEVNSIDDEFFKPIV